MRKAMSVDRPDAPTPAPESRATDLSRRRFLAALGASSAGSAAVAMGALPGVAAAPVLPPQATDEDSAYRETAHVRDYYRTAKI